MINGYHYSSAILEKDNGTRRFFTGKVVVIFPLFFDNFSLCHSICAFQCTYLIVGVNGPVTISLRTSWFQLHNSYGVLILSVIQNSFSF